MNQNKQLNNLIHIGIITNTHSLKGEVRLLVNKAIDNSFEPNDIIYYKDSNGEHISLEIETSRPHKKFILLKFKEYPTINEVEFLKKSEVYIERKKMTGNQFYYQDLIGFDVYENEKLVGKIKDYFDQKAYYSFTIVNSQNEEINVPILDKLIKKVDKQNQRLDIEFLDGEYDWK